MYDAAELQCSLGDLQGCQLGAAATRYECYGHELQRHLPWTERSQGGLCLTACTASVSCAALQTPSTLAGVQPIAATCQPGCLAFEVPPSSCVKLEPVQPLGQPDQQPA